VVVLSTRAKDNQGAFMKVDVHSSSSGRFKHLPFFCLLSSAPLFPSLREGKRGADRTGFDKPILID